MKTLLALFLLATSATAHGAAPVFCKVYTYAEPHMWTVKLLQVAGPVAGNASGTHALVNPDHSAAVEISTEDFQRRLSANDFKDWEGSTLFSFGQTTEDRYSVSGTVIESGKPFTEMFYTMAVGAVSDFSGLGLLVPSKGAFGLCTNKQD
jgi:hypothetical protein